MQPLARSARKRLTRRSSSEWNEIAARRPSGARTSQASGRAASSWPSSSLTWMRRAWKVRLAGWPPAKRAGAGIAALMTSTSSCVVSIGPSWRARTMARAIGVAYRSSPWLRISRARRRASQVLTISVAVSSVPIGSMRMSRGAS